MGFVSSAYLGKDFKLLGVSLVRKNYLKVGVKSMVNFQHGDFVGIALQLEKVDPTFFKF